MRVGKPTSLILTVLHTKLIHFGGDKTGEKQNKAPLAGADQDFRGDAHSPAGEHQVRESQNPTQFSFSKKNEKCDYCRGLLALPSRKKVGKGGFTD